MHLDTRLEEEECWTVRWWWWWGNVIMWLGPFWNLKDHWHAHLVLIYYGLGGMQQKGKDALMSGYHMQQYYLPFCCCSTAEGCILTQDWRRRNAGWCHDEAGNVIMWVHLELEGSPTHLVLFYNGMGGTQKKGKDDAMMSGYHMRQCYLTFLSLLCRGIHHDTSKIGERGMLEGAMMR